jgi:hypothetical protein
MRPFLASDFLTASLTCRVSFLLVRWLTALTDLAKEMVLLEQRTDSTLVPVHVSKFGTNLLSKKRARYQALL